jgi:hypothetical protein
VSIYATSLKEIVLFSDIIAKNILISPAVSRIFGSNSDNLKDKDSVVDRHSSDASILMPIQIRIRIGMKTMPIHMRILHQVLQMLQNREGKIYFYSQLGASLQCVIV